MIATENIVVQFRSPESEIWLDEATFYMKGRSEGVVMNDVLKYFEAIGGFDRENQRVVRRVETEISVKV